MPRANLGGHRQGFDDTDRREGSAVAAQTQQQ